MAEEQKKSLWVKIGMICLKSPISSLFAIAILYFAAKIYVLGDETLMNKAIMYGLFVLWGVYFAVRHLFKLIVVLGVLGIVGYGIYAYSQREIKKCEESGGTWNEKTNTCEYEESLLQKAQKIWKNFSTNIKELMSDKEQEAEPKDSQKDSPKE